MIRISAERAYVADVLITSLLSFRACSIRVLQVLCCGGGDYPRHQQQLLLQIGNTCFKSVTSVLQVCERVTRLLQVCYKCVTGVLQTHYSVFHKNVTNMLQICNK
jgi:hypothetical protein